MSRHRSVTWVGRCATGLSWGFALTMLLGCAPKPEVTPRTRLPAPPPPPPPAAAPTVEAPAAAPVSSVLDRDPDEERKKMALSRERSANARRMLKQGRFQDAVQQSRQALRVHELNVDAMLVIGEVMYRQGRHEMVETVTGNVLAIDPKVLTPEAASRAQNLRGFALLAQSKDAEALIAFRKAAEADAKNAAAWNNLGTRYLHAGDVDTAVACFKYATELEPGFIKAQLNLGAGLRAQGKLIEAEQVLMTVAELRPNHPAAYFNLGVLYLDAPAFPGLDLEQRLNKAVTMLQRYKAKFAANQVVDTAVPKGKTTLLDAKVSPERADAYIAAAKKNLERERRRQERERKRKEREAKRGQAEAQPTNPAGPDGAAPEPTPGPPAGDGLDGGQPTAPATPAENPAPGNQGPPPPPPAKPSPPPAPAPQRPQGPTPQRPAQPQQAPGTSPDVELKPIPGGQDLGSAAGTHPERGPSGTIDGFHAQPTNLSRPTVSPGGTLGVGSPAAATAHVH